ncbi:MAG TPA: crosslink repair DNA glycosylase YcaQ family protein [Nitriliruptorales bacterium]
MRTIPLERARRIALAAQGLHRPRPEGRVDVRHLRRTLDLNSVVQLDSVNVAARAHLMPFFSRLGPHERDRLDDWLWRSGENFEYWGHEASVMPLRVHPLMRHRMTSTHRWKGVERVAREHPGYIDRVLDEVRAKGPVTVGDLDDPGDRGGSWWGWNIGRIALEWLYVSGVLAIHQRDASFTLHYDLAERVLPAEVRDLDPVPRDRAVGELLLLGARAHGIGTVKDLADQFRLPIREARAAAARLAADGALEEVEVRGWRGPVYLHPDATIPRRVEAATLLSPFDPVVWFRERAERLFGFHYRIEIYVPKAQRRHGYYVLPFLLGEDLVARVDLVANRAAGRLLVPGSFAEDGVDVPRVAGALAAELRTFADWLGLGEIEVAPHGDLAPELATRI